jgi:phage terminase large subunit-like protein
VSLLSQTLLYYTTNRGLLTKAKSIPEEIREYIDYNPETGILTAKVSRKTAKAGEPVGNLNKLGYWVLKFNGTQYLQHRVAWYLHYGKDPEMDIDHMNGDRTDNRITNLRLATRQTNNQNVKALGVSFEKSRQKWVAQIVKDYKVIKLGRFDCPLLAGLAYQDAKKQLHPTAVR